MINQIEKILNKNIRIVKIKNILYIIYDMPEGPEIAFSAYVLKKLFTGYNVSYIKSTKFKINNTFTTNVKIKNIDSKGKILWIHLSNNKYLLFLFGMTGEIVLEREKYVKLIIKVRKNKVNQKIYFIDPRNFGHVYYINEDELNIKLNSLAPDFLKSSYTGNSIYTRLLKYITSPTRKNKTIYEILMDQTILGSGIGNYLSNEILYRANISPYTKLKDIDKSLCNKLVNVIKYVIKLSFYHNKLGYMNTIKQYFKYRKNKDFPKYQSKTKLKDKTFKYTIYRQKTDPQGNPVKIARIKGRTVYYVP